MMNLVLVWKTFVLNSFVLLCHSQQMPSYLTSADFANAAYVNTNQPMKVLLNDQRFHTKVACSIGCLILLCLETSKRICSLF